MTEISDSYTELGSSRLLHNDEAQHYIDLFLSQPPEEFAVIKVSGTTLADDDETAALTDAVAQMANVGLYPVLVHGGGPQINAALQAAGVGEQRLDGLRITDSEAIDIVEDTLTAINQRLVSSLGSQGLEATGLDKGVFRAVVKDYEKYGLVGDVNAKNVDISAVAAAARHGIVPVVSCLGTAVDGKPLNVNGDDAARALTEVLDPLKYVAITPTVGVLDRNQELISVLTLQSGLIRELSQTGILDGGMLKKVQEAEALLSVCPRMDVVFTAARFLLEELFSHRGHGTLITHNEQVRYYNGFNGVDEAAVHALLERSFDTKIDWQELKMGVEAVIVTNQTYHGVAIMKRIAAGEAYMDKLAVAPEARERGVAKTLLDRVAAEYPDGFYWRCRLDNRFLEKYCQFANYFEKRTSANGEEWVVFWHSLNVTEAPPTFSAAADATMDIPALHLRR